MALVAEALNDDLVLQCANLGLGQRGEMNLTIHIRFAGHFLLHTGGKRA